MVCQCCRLIIICLSTHLLICLLLLLCRFTLLLLLLLILLFLLCCSRHRLLTAGHSAAAAPTQLTLLLGRLHCPLLLLNLWRFLLRLLWLPKRRCLLLGLHIAANAGDAFQQQHLWPCRA